MSSLKLGTVSRYGCRNRSASGNAADDGVRGIVGGMNDDFYGGRSIGDDTQLGGNFSRFGNAGLLRDIVVLYNMRTYEYASGQSC